MLVASINRFCGFRRFVVRISSVRNFCDETKKPQDETPEKPEKAASPTEDAAERLNKLLSKMGTVDHNILKKKVEIPTARARRREERKKAVSAAATQEAGEAKKDDIFEATKKVASSLGGDAKLTEAEILNRLLGRSDKPGEGADLKDIIIGMKVDRVQKQKKRSDEEPSRAKFVKSVLSSGKKGGEPRKRTPQVAPVGQRTVVNLFGGEPLGIFKDPSKLQETPVQMALWRRLEERELKIAVTYPPANYFEKMAQWTEQGRLWKFPIDNEQDIGEEANVDFSEHVFLEEHLEPWCPPKGPIRHFMELVCVGLSKNAYLSVQEKKEHIEWFRDYFDSKKELLQQIIIEKKSEKGETKELE